MYTIDIMTIILKTINCDVIVALSHSSRVDVLLMRQLKIKIDSSTIARWIKSLLQDSGIDTDSFSAHSTRAAAASAAKRKGLATADILKMAGWSRVSTFERFYFKPTPSNNMGLLLVSL